MELRVKTDKGYLFARTVVDGLGRITNVEVVGAKDEKSQLHFFIDSTKEEVVFDAKDEREAFQKSLPVAGLPEEATAGLNVSFSAPSEAKAQEAVIK